MIVRFGKFGRLLTRIDEFMAVRAPRIEPRLDGLRCTRGLLFEADERLFRRLAHFYGYTKKCGNHVSFILVENLDDIARALNIQHLKNVCAGGQDSSGDINRLVKGDDSFLV